MELDEEVLGTSLLYQSLPTCQVMQVPEEALEAAIAEAEPEPSVSSEEETKNVEGLGLIAATVAVGIFEGH